MIHTATFLTNPDIFGHLLGMDHDLGVHVVRDHFDDGQGGTLDLVCL